jgi:hypothetical protein
VKGRALVIAGVLGVVLVSLAAVVAASWIAGRTDSAEDPRAGLDADEARFSWGDYEVEVPLFECGREGDVVVMAGQAGGFVLQVAADLGAGGDARTGITLDRGADGTLGAFGSGLEQGPAGEVTAVRTVGDSLVVEATWAELDPDTFEVLQRTDARPGAFDGQLVARCPEESDAS